MKDMKKKTISSALFVLTLTICASNAAAQTNLAANPVTSTAKAEPAAYELLRSAHDSRQTFPASFAGLTAEVVYNENGKIYTGTLDYTPKVVLQVTVPTLSEDQQKKLEGEISSLLMHRRSGDFAKGDGKHPITFGPDDGNPIGRLVYLNDEMQSSYRVRDKQVVQVNRAMKDERFTINVLETTSTPEGKFLPRQFTVTYFDAKTGAVKRAQAFTDTYAQVGGVWLPTMRRVITSENGQTSVRIMGLRQPKLKAATAQASHRVNLVWEQGVAKATTRSLILIALLLAGTMAGLVKLACHASSGKARLHGTLQSRHVRENNTQGKVHCVPHLS